MKNLKMLVVLMLLTSTTMGNRYAAIFRNVPSKQDIINLVYEDGVKGTSYRNLLCETFQKYGVVVPEQDSLKKEFLFTKISEMTEMKISVVAGKYVNSHLEILTDKVSAFTGVSTGTIDVWAWNNMPMIKSHCGNIIYIPAPITPTPTIIVMNDTVYVKRQTTVIENNNNGYTYQAVSQPRVVYYGAQNYPSRECYQPLGGGYRGPSTVHHGANTTPTQYQPTTPSGHGTMSGGRPSSTVSHGAMSGGRPSGNGGMSSGNGSGGRP